MSHGHPTDSQPTDGQGPPRETSPWTRPWFIASAAAVVLIAALGIAYLMIPSAGQSSAAPTHATTPTATSTGTSGGGGQESVCGLPAGDQRYPSVGFSSTWVLLGRTAVPNDPKGIGPGRVDGSVRTCYQHSPTGALYAAANALAAGSLPNGPAIIAKDLAADGPLRNQYLASPPAAVDPDPNISIQIGGFNVQSYDSQAATITLGLKVVNGTTNGFSSVTIPLKWEHGDWKVDFDAMGQPAPVNDLSSFVPWRGA